MEDYPTTIIELEDRFSTDQACREYLFRLRWPEGFRCPRCRHDQYWQRSNGLFECSGCGFQVSITAGTIFQDTKKPLRLWFRAVWHVTSQKYGANALGLQRVLGLGSYHTAWSWLHKLRRAMVRPGRDKLSGTVQVDESIYGGKKPGKRGRGASGKALVFIAAQVDGNRIGRIRLQVISDASAESLESAIMNSIAPGTIVQTDGWRGHSQIHKLGYTHEIVRSDYEIGDDLLLHCHRIASLLKRWLTGTHQGSVSHKHLGYYLDEFTFRYSRRTSRSRGKLFYRLLQQALMIDPVPNKSLVNKVNHDY